MGRISSITFLILLVFSGCKKESPAPCDESTPLYELANFPVGVAVSPFDLATHSAYREIAFGQFNRFTPDNALKPDALHPQRDMFSFQEADSLVATALRNDKTIHGHTLIWHNQLPAWMSGFSGNREEWIEIMRVHIQTVVSHFGNRVPSWDVANEAFEDNGDFRENIWHQNIGEDYLRLAFEFAHEANPDALLFYNDFGITQQSKKCKAILNHFSELRARGIPVHGIGLQLHIFNSTPSDGAIEKAVNRVVEEGFMVHFSEIDLSMNLSGGSMNLTETKLQKQGRRMKFLVDLFQEIPSSQQFGITVWGISDNDSWIPSYFGREDYPLLYDGQYRPKPMYCGFKEGLAD